MGREGGGVKKNANKENIPSRQNKKKEQKSKKWERVNAKALGKNRRNGTKGTLSIQKLPGSKRERCVTIKKRTDQQ